MRSAEKDPSDLERYSIPVLRQAYIGPGLPEHMTTAPGPALALSVSERQILLLQEPDLSSSRGRALQWCCCPPGPLAIRT
jgi:hypothetical protein